MIECNRCGKCCEFLGIRVDKRVEPILLEFLTARACQVEDNHDGTLYFIFDARCPCLTLENKCECYDVRPVVCAKYPLSGDWKPKECVM